MLNVVFVVDENDHVHVLNHDHVDDHMDVHDPVHVMDDHVTYVRVIGYDHVTYVHVRVNVRMVGVHVIVAVVAVWVYENEMDMVQQDVMIHRNKQHVVDGCVEVAVAVVFVN